MKDELITIFEDYENDFPSYREHLSNLNSLKEIVKSNHFYLQANGTFKVSHYVGFFQKGNTRLQILPKIYAKSKLGKPVGEEIKESLAFIYRLLYWSGYLNIKNLPSQFIGSSDNDLLEIFIGIFVDEFINLFQKNIYRAYETQEENQQFIRGKILFNETIKRNTFIHHLHYVRFDEFTINNPLNQIFKTLILLLLKKSVNGNNKKKLVIGLTYLQEVDTIKLDVSIWGKIKFDRLNNEFQPIFNLAKLFFYNQQPGIIEGEENTFSFLVPVHLLFENFVAKVLTNYSNDKIKFNYHKPKLYYGYEGIKKVFQLEPDFTITQDEKFIGILDAKYKYPYDENDKPTIDEKDLYQLSTYSLCYNCPFLVLIYPKFVDAPKSDVFLTEYILKGAFGDIALKIIQIDILDKDLNNISGSIRAHIIPVMVKV